MLVACAVQADLYTTGMTVVLVGFALEPLDCLLPYKSATTQLARTHSNCCEEGGAPGQGLLNLNEINCTTDLLINRSCTWCTLALSSSILLSATS